MKLGIHNLRAELAWSRRFRPRQTLFFFTLRDLRRQARMPGDYAVRAVVFVEHPTDRVWEGKL